MRSGVAGSLKGVKDAGGGLAGGRVWGREGVKDDGAGGEGGAGGEADFPLCSRNPAVKRFVYIL